MPGMAALAVVGKEWVVVALVVFDMFPALAVDCMEQLVVALAVVDMVRGLVAVVPSSGFA